MVHRHAFDQPRYLSRMPRGKGRSRCPFDSCGAGGPSVRDAFDSEVSHIPTDLRERAGSHPIQHCGYCDGLWWEEWVGGTKMWVLIGYS